MSTVVPSLESECRNVFYAFMLAKKALCVKAEEERKFRVRVKVR